MFNLGTIGAAVTLDDSQYRLQLQNLGNETKSMLGKIAGIGAAYIGFNSLKSAVEGSIKAFTVQENAVNALERALANKGASAYSEQLQQLASDLQAVTTYGDEATIATMALGINMGLPAEKMKDATKAAMGLAAAYSMDLNTAMQLMAKAYSGNTGALSRYGIKLDETKNKQEQFTEILEQGKKAFPLAEAQTTSQKLTQLSNAWGDLMEVIGEFIVELFDVKTATSDLTNTISNATAFIQSNVNKWVFEIKYVSAYFEAGVKAVWALFEPAVTYITQIVTSGVKNVIAIGQWGFDNSAKIWTALPDVFAAIGRDIVVIMKNVFNGLLNLAKNLGAAIWKAIKGDGLDGFKATWEKLQQDAIKTLSDSGRFTDAALKKAGVSAFPELQSANYNDMIEKYRNIDKTFNRIDRERMEKQYKLEAEYAAKLEKSKKPQNKSGGADEAGKKNNVAGSFSSAVLNAMLGAGTPEQETAKNTKEMVRLQRNTIAKIEQTASTYT